MPPLPSWLTLYLLRSRPLLAIPIAFSVFVLAKVAFQHSLDTFDTNPRIAWYNDAANLVMFVILPLYAIARAPLDFVKMWSGLLPSGRAVPYGLAVALLSVAYESLNLRLQFGSTLQEVPMDHAWISGWIGIVATPFVEELFFHVGLQTKLRRFGSVVSIGATALIFSAVHATHFDQLVSVLWTHAPPFILLGIVWNRYRSFGLCFIAHAGYDAIVYSLAKDAF